MNIKISITDMSKGSILRINVFMSGHMVLLTKEKETILNKNTKLILVFI